MEVIAAFLVTHFEKIIAISALLLALQANVISRKAKADSDRMLLSERRRDLLREIDKQHVTIHRLRFILEAEIVQLEQCSQLESLLSGERERLESNLETLDELKRRCSHTRKSSEKINVYDDPAQVDARFAKVGRLTAHLEKDIDNETSLLEDKKYLVKTAPKEMQGNEN